LKVVFDGDALSRAATARLDQCIRELEFRSGVARNEVAAFATHQPIRGWWRCWPRNLELHWNDFPWLPIRAGIWVRLLARRLCTFALEASERL